MFLFLLAPDLQDLRPRHHDHGTIVLVVRHGHPFVSEASFARAARLSTCGDGANVWTTANMGIEAATNGELTKKNVI